MMKISQSIYKDDKIFIKLPIFGEHTQFFTWKLKFGLAVIPSKFKCAQNAAIQLALTQWLSCRCQERIINIPVSLYISIVK